MRFTDRTIAALPSPERGQRLYTDDALPGFGLRIGATAKAFVLTVGEERRRITIGRYPVVSLAQAREKARNILAKRQLGLDHQPAPFFAEARERFHASRRARIALSTATRDARVLSRFSSLDRKRVGAITPVEVQAIIDRMKASTARDEAVQRFSSLIRFLKRKGEIKDWPVERLEGRRVPIYRDRVLNTEELKKVLITARTWRERVHPHDAYGYIIELLILTGARRAMIGGLRRSYVDFDLGTISWPAPEMKSKRQHVIPLGASVGALLEQRGCTGLYFPNKHGEPFTYATNLDRYFKKECGVQDWVLHDLRRVFATSMQRLGARIEVTERLLDHKRLTGGLVGVYQRHDYMMEMREAIFLHEKWIALLA
jgi:integrase